MAIGNVVGSNICNIALVLGVGAIIFPLVIQRQVIRREMPVLLGATLIFLLMIKDGVIDRLEGGGAFCGRPYLCDYEFSPGAKRGSKYQ